MFDQYKCSFSQMFGTFCCEQLEYIIIIFYLIFWLVLHFLDCVILVLIMIFFTELTTVFIGTVSEMFLGEGGADIIQFEGRGGSNLY